MNATHDSVPRRIGVGLLSACAGWLLSCSSTPRNEPATPTAADERAARVQSEFEKSMAAARDARRKADEMLAPQAPDSLDPASSMQFARTRVRPWIDARREATEAADAAYQQAWDAAGPEQQAQVLLESGELWKDFATALVAAGRAVLPKADGVDEATSRAMDAALYAAVAPQFQRARDLLVQCSMLSSARGDARDVLAACERHVRELDALSPQLAQESDHWAALRLDAPSRPRKTTRQAEPCVFAGSLKVQHAWLYANERAGTPVVGVEEVEVSKMRLPTEAGGRAAVELQWPLVASLWLDSDAQPFELTKKVDLVDGHVWLDAGALVKAWGPRSGRATVIHPRPAEEKRASTPELSERVACRDLVLAGSIAPATPYTEGEPGQLSGRVPLHPGPGEPQIGELMLGLPINVRVLRRRSGWAHIASRGAAPYDFDAWTPERFIPPGTQGFGLLSASPEGQGPERVSSAESALRLTPDPASPVVAKLARDVPLLTGREEGGFVAIKVPGATGGNAGKDFWISESDLKRKTQPRQ
jgi:hypothetical protein